MKKWVFISDLIFTFFVSFLPVLCLLRYRRWSILASVLVAALAALFITSVIAIVKGKKDARLLLRRKEEKERQKTLYHLALLPTQQSLRLLCKNGEISSQEGIFFIENERLVFTLFTWQDAEIDDVLPFIKICLLKQKEGTLYCNQLTAEADGLLAQFSVRTIKGTEVYLQLKEEGALPEEYLSEPCFTKKKKRLGRIWFSKKNSRRFLACGGLLLLSSLWVPFPYYYVAFGCAMVVAATLIRILGYR